MERLERYRCLDEMGEGGVVTYFIAAIQYLVTTTAVNDTATIIKQNGTRIFESP